ncbi:glycosyltransferase [Endozoicomonas sp. GU-1]|uniref:glycosyltransferase n=1 Tax=Endozoicomonas sp. GU-1 TaxID=3009078 RepID=UPI0022B32AA2|nr:glycosyltransferase [Endozoicomonas sp. GU-1]WBA81058.1 glycosyltransferase [Endozoicomonas sp. GU-1]WBA88622.1 glycosyltransferase [Endozoicomonas sp. GU-1]
MKPISSTQVTSLCLPGDDQKVKQNHIHISTEGYRYTVGGNGVFVNTFCKAFHERSCRNIMVLPLLEFVEDTDVKKSITSGCQLSSGELILVERCSDMPECDVYRVQPTGRQKRYFEKHINSYNIEQEHKDSLAEDLYFKEQGINDSDERLRSGAAISLKMCVFNQIAAKFVNEVLLPTMGSEKVYVHDHFFGGSLQYINHFENVKKVNWVHCLSPHTGFSDCMANKKPVYTTQSYMKMDESKFCKLPDYEKPARERAIKHADVILTVSKYAQSFLTFKHPLISNFLRIHKKEISSIKSCSDLSKFSLSATAKKYGLEGTPEKNIKSKLRDLFFAGKLPLKPPLNSKGCVNPVTKNLPIVFFMGRPHFEKGTEHVLNMVKKLDCLFFIVSNGTEKDPFIQAIQETKAARNNLVLLTKNQEHKQLLMAVADYAVIPSLAESLGLIAGECHSMGLHVINSDVGGLPEASPPCDECRTEVHSNAEYGHYSEDTDKAFLRAVSEKLKAGRPRSSHIVRHASYFHSMEKFTTSIENALSN